MRHVSDEDASSLDENDQLIRQFLRGDPVGPITRRREETNYAEDLLQTADPLVTASPAVEATRKKPR